MWTASVDALCPVLKCVISVGIVSACLNKGSRSVVLQSSVIAPKRLADQVRLYETLCIVGTQLKLEALAQTRLYGPDAGSEAGHIGVPAHHGHEVDNVVSRTAKCCKTSLVKGHTVPVRW